MDRRNEELVFLRKAYKREKRCATGGWKFLFFLCLLLCLTMVPGCLALLLPESTVTYWVFQGIRIVSTSLGGSNPSGDIQAWLANYSGVFWIVLAVAFLVLVVSMIMWIAGSRKLRRTDAFLSYRTLRETLKEEKKYQ